MRQKYTISKTGSQNDLTIREYAVVGKNPGQKIGTMPLIEEYSFLCQQIYNGEDIKISLLKGSDDLITVLRTTNLFPTGTLVAKLAEIVTALYGSSEDGSAELFFDDIDQFESDRSIDQDSSA